MAINKQKKEELVGELLGVAKDAKTIVFTTFKGLTVNNTIVMRKALHNENVGYRVAKKTLLKRALGELSIKGEFPEVASELAIAYSTDLLSPARLTLDFAKLYKGKFDIVGGVFDGKYMTRSEMLEIATIPGREVLLSKIAFLLQSPMQRLAIAVNEVAKTK